MTTESFDLVALVADKNMEQTLLGLFTRHRSLNLRPFNHQIFPHPEHDPGCFLRSPEFLRPFLHRSRHALVLFDREGCGREDLDRESLEADLEERLHQSGWGERAAAIAIDPELESWFWSPSPKVEEVIGWKGRGQRLRHWLEEQGYLMEGSSKPTEPKEALERALFETRRARSGAIYKTLAGEVGLGRCQDPTFLRFRTLLQAWFPAI